MPENLWMDHGINSNENPSPEQMNAQIFFGNHDEVEGEARLLEILKAMSAETVELSGYLAREKELTEDLCETLYEILAHLKISFTVPKEKVVKFNSALKIELDQEAQLVIFWPDNKVDTKPLKNYTPDVVLAVFWAILPELGKAVRTSIELVKRRISVLEKIRKQMKSFHETLKKPSNESFRLVQDEDSKSSLIDSSQKPLS